MVNTRVEVRVEELEREVSEVKQGITNLEKEMTVVRDLLAESLEVMKHFQNGKSAREETSSTPLVGRDGGRTENRLGEQEPNRFRKLELPLFSGDDPGSWLFRIERYFNVNRILEEEKLDAVAVCLEGRALHWFQWMETWQTVNEWGEFKKLLLMRFGYLQKGDGCEKLMALKQTGSLAEYIESFEIVSAPLKGIPPTVIMGAFKNGLREEIRAELRLMKLQGLPEVIEMALRLE